MFNKQEIYDMSCLIRNSKFIHKLIQRKSTVTNKHDYYELVWCTKVFQTFTTIGQHLDKILKLMRSLEPMCDLMCNKGFDLHVEIAIN